jgi:hypothetical protein
MSPVNAFLLGLIVAWAPSLIVLTVLLSAPGRRQPTRSPTDRARRNGDRPRARHTPNPRNSGWPTSSARSPRSAGTLACSGSARHVRLLIAAARRSSTVAPSWPWRCRRRAGCVTMREPVQTRPRLRPRSRPLQDPRPDSYPAAPRQPSVSRALGDRRRSAAGARPARSPLGERARTSRGSAASRVIASAATRSPPGATSRDGAPRPP